MFRPSQFRSAIVQPRMAALSPTTSTERPVERSWNGQWAPCRQSQQAHTSCRRMFWSNQKRPAWSIVIPRFPVFCLDCLVVVTFFSAQSSVVCSTFSNRVKRALSNQVRESCRTRSREPFNAVPVGRGHHLNNIYIYIYIYVYIYVYIYTYIYIYICGLVLKRCHSYSTAPNKLSQLQ